MTQEVQPGQWDEVQHLQIGADALLEHVHFEHRLQWNSTLHVQYADLTPRQPNCPPPAHLIQQQRLAREMVEECLKDPIRQRLMLEKFDEEWRQAPEVDEEEEEEEPAAGQEAEPAEPGPKRQRSTKSRAGRKIQGYRLVQMLQGILQAGDERNL